MNVQKKNFDKNVVQFSPLMDDYVRIVKNDEKGEEFITWEKFDSAEYQKSLGPVDNWGLNSLLKAGINPDFSISTGYPSRIEGVNSISKAESYVEEILAESNNENNEE